MRFPAYLLLPVAGAVVLIVAVLGSWLWPEPAVPTPSMAPSVIAAPVAVEPSPPPPSFTPPQPKPMPQAAPLPKAAKVEPPPQAVAEPVVVAQPPPPPPPEEPPPGPTTSPRMSDWSPEKQAEVKRNWMNVRERAGELAMVGLKHLERQRDEARARGDHAEAERLEQVLRTRREQTEKMLRAQQANDPGMAVPTPEAQAGPPLQ